MDALIYLLYPCYMSSHFLTYVVYSRQQSIPGSMHFGKSIIALSRLLPDLFSSSLLNETFLF
jgi:hypothetical protein